MSYLDEFGDQYNVDMGARYPQFSDMKTHEYPTAIVPAETKVHKFNIRSEPKEFFTPSLYKCNCDLCIQHSLSQTKILGNRLTDDTIVIAGMRFSSNTLLFIFIFSFIIFTFCFYNKKLNKLRDRFKSLKQTIKNKN